MTWPDNVGILALEVYIPNTYVSHEELETYDGVSKGKYTVGLGQRGMGFCSDAEDICSLSLTAVRGLMERQNISYSDIGHLQVGTETIQDKSKAVKTVLMELFVKHGNADIEGVDCMNACYGGTAALFNAVNWIESSAWDGRYAIVVAADIAVYASGPARPTGGAGAVAMLVGANATLSLDRGVRATYMDHVYDFYKPDMSSEYPRVNGKLSIQCFLKALDQTYKGYKDKVARKYKEEVDISYFDYMTFHSPYCKLVQKAFGRLTYQDYLSSNSVVDHLEQYRHMSVEDSYLSRDLEKAFTSHSTDEYEKRTSPSLLIPRNVGNMYTATLYACIASLFVTKTPEELTGKRLGAFSYGSGLAATMFSFTVTSDLDKLRKFCNTFSHIQPFLDSRTKVDPEEFEAMMKFGEVNHHKPDRSPVYPASKLNHGTYHIVQVDSEHRRTYSRTSVLDTMHSSTNSASSALNADCAAHYCPHM